MMYQLFSGFKKEKIFLVFLLFFQLELFAQNKTGNGNVNSFSYYTDSLNKSYSTDKPYYIISWNNNMPLSISVIRMINEKTAVIKISGEDEIELLKTRFSLVTANNLWKYSPALLKNIERNKPDVEGERNASPTAAALIRAASLDRSTTKLNRLPSRTSRGAGRKGPAGAP